MADPEPLGGRGKCAKKGAVPQAWALLGRLGVTAPRQVLPGKTYLLTRRCAQRQYLLGPSALTRQVFGYVLAVAAGRFGVQVHACCVMSNHVHLLVTDPHARLPAFKQFLDSLVARALNAALGRWESFWAPGSYSAVVLVGPEDVVDKAAYTLANPVLAGLVKRGERWAGLWGAPGMSDPVRLQFARPAHFFRANGGMPERATLRFVEPPGLDGAAFRRALELALAAKERAAATRACQPRREGRPGEMSLTGGHVRRPATPEPRRGLRPRTACRDRWKRIEVLGRLSEFLDAYKAALRAWRSGVAAVVFPAGTYLMRVMHRVACAPIS